MVNKPSVFEPLKFYCTHTCTLLLLSTAVGWTGPQYSNRQLKNFNIKAIENILNYNDLHFK